MKLTYRKIGDYLIPNIETSESPKIGKYGMLRRSYLKKHQQETYTGLWLSGKLNQHLEEIDQQAGEMMERLISQMAKAQGITEDLKAKDQLRWAGVMNSIHEAAEEIVLSELIYGQLMDRNMHKSGAKGSLCFCHLQKN